MISANAEASIERLFENAIRGNAALPDDRCRIDWRDGRAAAASAGNGAGNETNDANNRRRLVALTVSTYLFRIVALFDFGGDPATAAHLARLSRSGKAVLAGQELHDACNELGNVICGEVNRGLSSRFRHAGMSTPFVLEGSCIEHLESLAPSAVWRAEVTVNDEVRFVADVCLCAGRDADLDFHIEPEQQLETAGELELF